MLFVLYFPIGFAGKTALDQGQVDMIIDSIEECTPKLRMIMREQAAEKKVMII